MWQNILLQKTKKIHRVDPEIKMSQTERQTDGLMNWSDFIEPLQQTWRFDHVFWKFENKFSFEIIWLNCEPCRNNQYKKKENNQLTSVFKEFKNNDP